MHIAVESACTFAKSTRLGRERAKSATFGGKYRFLGERTQLAAKRSDLRVKGRFLMGKCGARWEGDSRSKRAFLDGKVKEPGIKSASLEVKVRLERRLWAKNCWAVSGEDGHLILSGIEISGVEY